jgi:hypothetical protein
MCPVPTAAVAAVTVLVVVPPHAARTSPSESMAAMASELAHRDLISNLPLRPGVEGTVGYLRMVG